MSISLNFNQWCFMEMEFNPDDLIAEQIPLIRKIIQDETWYEGERRQCPVNENDIVVQKRVSEIILRYSKQILEESLQRLLKRI